jgi:hypothetical protein
VIEVAVQERGEKNATQPVGGPPSMAFTTKATQNAPSVVPSVVIWVFTDFVTCRLVRAADLVRLERLFAGMMER